MQKSSISGLKQMINSGLGGDFFYSKEMLNGKLLSALDKLIETDIIGVLEADAIAKMYNIRYEALTLIHHYDILKSLINSKDERMWSQLEYIEKEIGKMVIKFETEIKNDKNPNSINT